jgi:hypothetical protein
MHRQPIRGNLFLGEEVLATPVKDRAQVPEMSLQDSALKDP